MKEGRACEECVCCSVEVGSEGRKEDRKRGVQRWRE